MMDIRYCCPFWGSENIPVAGFFEKLLQEGYDGVEINLPDTTTFIDNFFAALNKIRAAQLPGFIFIGQQVLSLQQETPEDYLKRMQQRLEFLASLRPDFINSHTGKDYYSFDENCFIIEAAENIAVKTGIPVYHEIHRGRFTFHLQTLMKYLEKFPELKFTGDLSHWCTVSESLLQGQQEMLARVFPNIHHIHARIGFEQAPQVNDPFAPEWEAHLQVYIDWWQKIIDRRRASVKTFTITPEFGPPPYMPVAPFSKKPLTDQWETNSRMKNLLKSRLT